MSANDVRAAEAKTRITIPRQAWDWFVTDLPISVRLKHVLDRAGCRYLGDLRGWTYQEVLRIKGCGAGTIRELKALIERIETEQFTAAELADEHARQCQLPELSPQALTVFGQLMDTPISIPPVAREWRPDDLDISVRLLHVLSQAGYQSLGDLHGLTYRDILRVRNCGRKTILELKELIEALHAHQALVSPVEAVVESAADKVERALLKLPPLVREWPLAYLPLSTRLANALKWRGIGCLGELQDNPLSQAFDVRGGDQAIIAELGALVDRIHAGEFVWADAQSEDFDLARWLRDIDQKLERLPQREREILELRLGGHGGPPVILAEIGQRYQLSRERIRQLSDRALECLTRAGWPPLAALPKLLAERCLTLVCPLTPAVLAHWIGSATLPVRFPLAFYLRLCDAISPDFPLWLEDPRTYYKASRHIAPLAAQLQQVLQDAASPLRFKPAFDTLQTAGLSPALTVKEFFAALKLDPRWLIDWTIPDQPTVCLRRVPPRKLKSRECLRQVLAQSARPLKPEEIAARLADLFGEQCAPLSPRGVEVRLRFYAEFLLLGPRAFGLRQHVRLPERLWGPLQDEFYQFIRTLGRPALTSRFLAQHRAAWEAQTTRYEIAHILRHDARFADWGRFLFGLAEWGRPKRKYVRRLAGDPRLR